MYNPLLEEVIAEAKADIDNAQNLDENSRQEMEATYQDLLTKQQAFDSLPMVVRLAINLDFIFCQHNQDEAVWHLTPAHIGLAEMYWIDYEQFVGIPTKEILSPPDGPCTILARFCIEKMRFDEAELDQVIKHLYQSVKQDNQVVHGAKHLL